MTAPAGATPDISLPPPGDGEPSAVFPPAATGFPFAVGTFVMDSEIGRGGMGVVYRGHDVTGRLVALKAPLVADPERLQRFHLEARVLRRLNHPGVVAVLDHGDVNGWPYFVMEHVAGKPLTRALVRPSAAAPEGDNEATRLPSEAADALGAAQAFARFRHLVCQHIAELCDALEHVHGQGLVHRDLKPGNVLVGAGGQVKLMDFGLVSAASARLNLTVPGQLLGTIRYMSPEQISGQDVDPRTDLYSVGVLLYELLAGKRPFDADTFGPILLGHLQLAPPDPVTLETRLDRPLAAVILRCLEKRPEQRYPSAKTLGDQLRALIDADRTLQVRAASATAGRQVKRDDGAALVAPAATWSHEAAATIAAIEALVGASGLSWAAVRGERGAGKSRYLSEVGRRAASRSAMVLRAELRRDAGGPASLFGELMAPVVAPLKRASAAAVAAALGRHARLLVPLMAGVADLPGVRAMPAPLEVHGKLTFARSLSYLARVLRHIGRDRPIALMVDGLHHAGLQTIQAVGAVARTIAAPAGGRAGSCLLVVSCGDEPDGPDSAKKIAELCRDLGRQPAISARLSSLDAGAAERVVVSMLGQSAPEGLLAAVLHLSSGIPGALVEAMRLLVSIGALRRPEGAGWTFDASSAGALGGGGRHIEMLAERLSAVLRARAGELSAAAGTMLELASVLASGFAVELLMGIWEADGSSGAAGLDALQELRERGLLCEASTDGGYALSPRPLAGLVQSGLSPERRREVNARAAQRLVRGGSPRLDEALAAARHFSAASSNQDAIDWYLYAARAALAAYAHDTAIMAFRDVLVLGGHDLDPKQRAGISCELGRVLDLAGKLSEALSEVSRARFLARAAGQRDLALEAGVARVDLMTRLGKVDEAIAAAEALQGEASETADLRARARYWTSFAAALMARSEPSGAREHYTLALEAWTNLGATDDIQRTLGDLAEIDVHLGEPVHAEQRYRRALDLAGGRETAQAAGLMVRFASLLEQRGEVSEALLWYEQALGRFRHTGVRSGEAGALGSLGRLRARCGQLDQAATLLEQAVGIDVELSPSRDTLRRQLQLAAVRGERGDLERSRSELVVIAAQASELGDAVTAAECRLALARLAVVVGDRRAARAELAELLSAPAASDDRDVSELVVAAQALALCVPNVAAAAPPPAADVLAERADRLTDPALAVWTLLAVGHGYLAARRVSEALECARRARRRAVSASADFLVLLTLAAEVGALTVGGASSTATAARQALEAAHDRLATACSAETTAALRRHPSLAWLEQGDVTFSA
ncbi:MAG: protein kinase [Candidatus Schekmanbacteria bacterium]|nr:protein kinase [Candidatus Schekmanbacteria bacterium]